jgi:hypothetical protein
MKEEDIRDFFQKSPGLFGYVFIGLGIFLIIGAMRNWGWLLESGNERAFNMAWFVNTFGRKAARILYAVIGLVFIQLGAVWIFSYSRLKM